MSWLYLSGSLLGIALLTGLNLALFRGARTSLGTTEALRRRLAQEILGFRAGACVFAADGRAALVENTRDRATYFVECLGDGLVTRKLAKGYVAAIERNGARLALRFTDFTLPKAELRLADEGLARRWEERLKA